MAICEIVSIVTKEQQETVYWNLPIRIFTDSKGVI